MTALADLAAAPMVTVTEITVDRLDPCDTCGADAPITVTWTPTERFGQRHACWIDHREALEIALDDARDDTTIRVELQHLRGAVGQAVAA